MRERLGKPCSMVAQGQRQGGRRSRVNPARMTDAGMRPPVPSLFPYKSLQALVLTTASARWKGEGPPGLQEVHGVGGLEC